jgi:CRISPR-associated endonuclease Cas1
MARTDGTNQPAPLSRADVDATVDELARVHARDATNDQIVVLDGAGCALRVRYGSLVAEDGIGRQRRTRRFSRAAPPERVVVLATSGFLGLDALAWCDAVGTPVVGIDPHDGEVRYMTATNSKRDQRLLRAQAAAGMTDEHPTGVAIVRRLLQAKLVGDARVMRDVLGLPSTAQTIEDLAAALDDATTIERARQLEASAASAFYAGWVDHLATRPRFAERDVARVPEHWLRYDGRRSVLGARSSNRRAERPLNAVINYTTALAKAEAVLALRVVGLSPDLGLLHLDAAGRPSMALDVLEPVRPHISEYVLDLFAQRTWRKAEFVEGPDGAVRLGVALRQELASSVPMWTRLVAPHVEAVAHALGKLVATDYQPTAPITGERRKAGQARVKARKATAAAARLQLAARAAPVQPMLPLTATCVECGGPLERDRHQRCPRCWATQPGQDGATRRHRGRAISASRAELERWRADHPGASSDPETFRRNIFPGLAHVRLTEIMTACGVAKSTASAIRAGARVPQLRHWEALASLAGSALQGND